MTSDRPYRAGMAHEYAVAELVRCAGSQFDPRIVAALVSHLARGEDQPRFTTER
jgi:HD-GYP domain-containing protein (c-di-GMP phosphodiesterase class II)